MFSRASISVGPVIVMLGGTLGTLNEWANVLRSPSLSSTWTWNDQSPMSSSLSNASEGVSDEVLDRFVVEPAGRPVMVHVWVSEPPSASPLFASRVTVAFHAGVGERLIDAVGGSFQTLTT